MVHQRGSPRPPNIPKRQYLFSEEKAGFDTETWCIGRKFSCLLPILMAPCVVHYFSSLKNIIRWSLGNRWRTSLSTALEPPGSRPARTPRTSNHSASQATSLTQTLDKSQHGEIHGSGKHPLLWEKKGRQCTSV